jgi:hypothetical protein
MLPCAHPAADPPGRTAAGREVRASRRASLVGRKALRRRVGGAHGACRVGHDRPRRHAKIDELSCLALSRPGRDGNGLWRSLVAHLTGGQGVAGSNPVSPTSKKPRNYADLACSGAFLFGSARFKSCHPDKKAQVRSGFLAWASSFPGLHCSGPQKSWLLRSAPSLLLALVARGDQTWPISLGSRGTNPGMGRCRGAISGSAGFHLWSDPGCPGRLGLPSRRLGEEGVCLACGVEQMSGVRVEVEPGRLDRSGAQHLLKYV